MKFDKKDKEIRICVVMSKKELEILEDIMNLTNTIAKKLEEMPWNRNKDSTKQFMIEFDNGINEL